MDNNNYDERFTTPLKLIPNAILGLYVTDRTFKYDIGFKGSGHTIRVPKGFKTDLATIPRFLWWIIPPADPKYAAASVIHDYLYNMRSVDGRKYERSIADAIFYESMKSLGVNPVKAWIMYKCVRIFGGFYY